MQTLKYESYLKIIGALESKNGRLSDNQDFKIFREASPFGERIGCVSTTYFEILQRFGFFEIENKYGKFLISDMEYNDVNIKSIVKYIYSNYQLSLWSQSLYHGVFFSYLPGDEEKIGCFDYLPEDPPTLMKRFWNVLKGFFKGDR